MGTRDLPGPGSVSNVDGRSSEWGGRGCNSHCDNQGGARRDDDDEDTHSPDTAADDKRSISGH